MTIADNLKRVEDRIADAAARSGRDPSAITLVAVSKSRDAEEILMAANAGLRHFGENRVDEGKAKIAAVNARTDRELTWHMVGHLQSRKSRMALELFDTLHSVDSVRLANRLSRQASAMPRQLDVLLQVNVSGEASKSGFAGYNWQQDSSARESLFETAKRIAQLPNLNLRGLMTMAPLGADDATNRAIFRDLFALRAALSDWLAIDLPDLSMGMTDDFEVAIEEGATIVRIGRAIFGARPS